MIEVLSGFPEYVVALRVHDQATDKDNDNVLIPAIQAAFTRDEKISLYYELAPDFDGIDFTAALEDLGVGAAYLSRWTRIAFVGDHKGFISAIELLRFLFPCPVKVFPLDQADAAKTWVSGK
jgi:SpoIIAA-like